jgi:hypothetical protein
MGKLVKPKVLFKGHKQRTFNFKKQPTPLRSLQELTYFAILPSPVHQSLIALVVFVFVNSFDFTDEPLVRPGIILFVHNLAFKI